MTNNQIIRNEAARLDPATLHAIATAHHAPEKSPHGKQATKKR